MPTVEACQDLHGQAAAVYSLTPSLPAQAFMVKCESRIHGYSLVTALTPLMFQKFDNRLGTVSGSTGVGLEPVGTGTKRFRPAPTLGNPTRRGRGGGPQAAGLLTAGGRPAPVEQPNVKKR